MASSIGLSLFIREMLFISEGGILGEGKNERRTVSTHLLVYSPNACNGGDMADLQLPPQFVASLVPGAVLVT